MAKTSTASILFSLAALAMTFTATAQTQSFRPPAVPLVTCDPYFSIWSFSNHPADDWTKHWTGANMALTSMVRIDGKCYRILSIGVDSLPELPLENLIVNPTQTIYQFSGKGIELSLTFTTPLIPDDLSLMSQPITYLSWNVRSGDGKEHEVSIYFDNSAELVVNTPDEKVIWSRYAIEGTDDLSLGSLGQPVLQKSGDNLRIDWGYFYSCSLRSQNAVSSICSGDSARTKFIESGSLPNADDLRFPRRANDDWPVLSYVFDLGKVSASPVQRFIVLAYDDKYSIEYFHRRLQPYWKAEGLSTNDLIENAVNNYSAIMKRCEDFDSKLMASLRKAGGEKYAQLCALAYRQAIAAHKLTADIDGTPLLFPKEDFSNGCISTVDVIYPTAPIFLLFNTDLLKASVTPVLEYAGMKRWHFPFAPHDLGTYPLANGQVYGGGETSEADQMPVEECGNMVILLYAISYADHSPEFALKYWSSLSKWAEYLKNKGLDPENQLCTDDFAGHLAHNVNLSLKAIIALGCYSKMSDMCGKKEEAQEYWRLAEQYAERWEQMANDGDHYRLAFDSPGTWSQKYNLVWDKILDLNLFPEDIAQKEIKYYETKLNRYGLPLDNRKDYTKTDWTIWTATLASDQKDFEEIVSHVYDFTNETPNRVPLTDWYDTKTAKQVGFQARSVVGGLFIKMLSDKEIWKEWMTKKE